MVKKSALFLLLVILLTALPGISHAQGARGANGASAASDEAKAALAAAAKATGAENLKTLKYSGSGSIYIPTQTGNTGSLQRVWLKSYTREMDLNAPAARTQLVLVPEGAKADQTQTETMGASSPWALQYSYWTTPYGFLKGAQAGNATVTNETLDGTKYKVVSFMMQNNKVSGYINDANMVERVQTLVDGALVEVVYRGYADFSGVKVPDTIIQKQGGFVTLLVIVNDVKPNATVSIPPAR